MRLPAAAPGRPDYILLLLTAALTIVGLVAVWSASFVIGLAQYGNPYHFIYTQIVWCVFGLALMVAASRTNYELYRRHAVTLMVGTLIVLIAVLVAGNSVNGARRWIGVGPLSFQPAEYAKLTVTLYLAAWLVSKGDSIRSFENGLAPFVIIIAMVGVLIMLQPSLGTTLIIFAITVTMFFVAGASFKQMAALAAAGLLAVVVLATVAGYRLDRVTTFLSPQDDPSGKGFQTQQALVALGNGGVQGLGLGASRGKFFYIPESHTDGVYAIIGEESGLVGTTVVLFFYVALMIRGFTIARRCQDEFGMLVATGITTWLAIQALLNMAGITSMAPLTGVPLPFLSYGGNALASTLLAMGVLMSISRYGTMRPASADAPPGGRIIRRRRRT
jgi:cell division protein FtsW